MTVVVLRLQLLLLVSFIVQVIGIPLPSVTDVMMDDDSVEIISLNESQYCFVNQNTIRVSDDFTSELQDIVNKTEHVIISTTINSTAIFIAPSNGSRCHSEEDDNTVTTPVFLIQMIIYSVTILSTVFNISLHLLIKELHTIPGLLIITMCSVVIVITAVGLGDLVYAYSVDEENALVCVLFVYIIFFLLCAYQSIKLSILFHFAYLMYKSYKLIPQETVYKLCVIKYIIFVLITSTLCLLVAMGIDLAVSGTVSNGQRSFCVNSDIPVEDAPVFSLAATAELAVFVILEITVFSIGLSLYFLVNKSCCAMKSTNLRVAVTLSATIGINIIILVILYVVGVQSNVIILSVTSGTAVEQIILLTLFLSSRNVRAHFPCMRKRASTSDSPQTQQTSLDTSSM